MGITIIVIGLAGIGFTCGIIFAIYKVADFLIDVWNKQ
jgi:hypothetical protein